jgi:hypothetical protein
MNIIKKNGKGSLYLEWKSAGRREVSIGAELDTQNHVLQRFDNFPKLGTGFAIVCSSLVAIWSSACARVTIIVPSCDRPDSDLATTPTPAAGGSVYLSPAWLQATLPVACSLRGS